MLFQCQRPSIPHSDCPQTRAACRSWCFVCWVSPFVTFREWKCRVDDSIGQRVFIRTDVRADESGHKACACMCASYRHANGPAALLNAMNTLLPVTSSVVPPSSEPRIPLNVSHVAFRHGRRPGVPRGAEAGTRAYLCEAAHHRAKGHDAAAVLPHARLQDQPRQRIREHRRLQVQSCAPQIK